MSAASAPLILTLSCPDAVGIVHAVTGFLAERRCNIVESAQFADSRARRFFMRIVFDTTEGLDAGGLSAAFRPLAERFSMAWRIHDPSVRSRLVILVSRFGHCLNDLLFRHASNALPVDIAAVVSNHRDHESLVAAHGIPFRHLPVTKETKPAQEAALERLIDDAKADLVVLARYMQVLSPAMCRTLAGRAINIHHSFLPSFKGAKPYSQAFEHGVKLVGATAHYVTAELDEGPIIEQCVQRVDHSYSVEDLTAIGRDVECVALSRAVHWHVQNRVLLNGNKTVVFR